MPAHVQELHQIAQGLLSNLLRNLCTYQVEDTFAAPVPTAAPGEPGSLPMEPWLPERYGTLDAAVQPPAWREPSTEQVPGPAGRTLCLDMSATFNSLAAILQRQNQEQSSLG